MVKPASGAFIPPVADEHTPGLTQPQRVYRALRGAIDRGALAHGARLPSARQLARDWGLARGAVDEAFAQLQLEGAIERRVGDGTYVTRPAPAVARERGVPSALARRVLRQSAALDVPPSRIECAERSMRTPPLHPRATDVDAFPLDLWRRLMVATASERRRDLLGELPAVGLAALREAIVRHLALHRGVSVDADRVLVLATPAEGLALVVRLLLQPGERFWFEDPSHPSLPWLLQSLGAQVQGVPLDAHGFDLDAGRAATGEATPVRLVYLHPLNQYPLNVRTTVARGDALLAWTRRAGAWVIEGHFNDELWAPGSTPPTLLQRDPERVFMVGTFEGIVHPSVRLAYLIVPPSLREPFVDAQTLWGARAGVTLQATLADFIDDGHLHEHLGRLRERQAARRRIVDDVLLRHLPAGVAPGPLTPVPNACLHLPDGAAAGADVELAGRLRKRGVLVEPLSPMVWSSPRRAGLVFGYGGWDDATLTAALGRLREALAATFGARSTPLLDAA